MNYKIICALVASIASVSCFIPYIRDIFKGTTTPHKYTWLIWTILQITGSFIMFNEDAGLGALSLAAGGLLCGFIFILSIKRGTKNITFFDIACLIGALISICIWVFLKNPILSIILISLIDFIGFLPTLRKIYIEPYSETVSTYFLSVISVSFSLLVISDYNFSTVFYLATLIGTNSFCVIEIIYRKHILDNKNYIPSIN